MVKQEFVVIVEKIATAADSNFEVMSSIKCAGSVFQNLFGVEYPSGRSKGDKIAMVKFGSVNLTLFWGYELESNVQMYQVLTNGSWTLFQCLYDHGFRLLEQRNYMQVQSGTFAGRKLAERVFVRDVQE